MEKQKKNVEVPFWTLKRFAMCVLLSFGCFNTYTLRFNINIAVVCMVNQTALKNHQYDNTTMNQNKSLSECKRSFKTAEKATQRQEGDFVWDKEVQGQILGAFFWPYALLQIPSGIFITKYGAKNIFGVCMILASIVTSLLPILSRYSYVYTIVLRAALGIFQESKLVLLQLFLGQVSCVNSEFAGGWALSFYVFGILNFVWSIVWLIFTSDSPEKSNRISDIEKEYIVKALEIGEESEMNNSIPWKNIFTSVPVLASILSLFTSDWAIQFLATFIPTYIDDVFNLKIEDNGIITAMTSVPQCILGLVCGWLADFVHKKWLSISNTRKLFNTISAIIPALLLASLGYVDCSLPMVAVVIMTLNMTVRGFRSAGNEIAITDLAPVYAGLIFSFANTASAIGGYLATILTSHITQNSLQEEWQTSFFVTAAVEIFGGIVFMIFSSFKVQFWATGHKSKCVRDESVEIVRWQNLDQIK